MKFRYGCSWDSHYRVMLMRLTLRIFLICLCSSSYAGSVHPAGPAGIGIGEVLPEAAMPGLNGPTRKLSEFRGKPLIINVWASWCGPCRAEMASLERLAWRDESRYFNVIGISTDDHPARAMAFLTASNATIAHFIDANLRLEKLLGASRLPLTVLIDREGRVLEKVYGARAWDTAPNRLLISRIFTTDGR